MVVFKILEYFASDRAHSQFITPQVVMRIDITERLSMIESKKFHDVSIAVVQDVPSTFPLSTRSLSQPYQVPVLLRQSRFYLPSVLL